MLRDELVQAMIRRLAFRPGITSNVIAELQIAQEELEKERHTDQNIPWFLLSEIATANNPAIGDERLPLPSNFLGEYENGTLWRFDDTADPVTADPWIEMIKGTYDNLKAEYIGQGPTLRYSIVGEYFRLHPTPDKIYTYKMLFYKQDDVLSTNIENKWLKYSPWMLGGKAGEELAETYRDDVAIAYFQKKFAEAKTALHRRMTEREVVNDDATMDEEVP